MRFSWNEAMERFAVGGLIEGIELTSLFRGIGPKASTTLAPESIVEIRSLPEIPFTAARLAFRADGSRSETAWLCDGMTLFKLATDLAPDASAPSFRNACIGMGAAAEAAATLMRAKMMEPLTFDLPETPEQLAAVWTGDAE